MFNAADYKAEHFQFGLDGRVATITLNRPERKNPLTFESYAELRDLFRNLVYSQDVKAVVVTGAGGNFCSGGVVHEIIGPPTTMDMPELLSFTRMLGGLERRTGAWTQSGTGATVGIDRHRGMSGTSVSISVENR